MSESQTEFDNLPNLKSIVNDQFLKSVKSLLSEIESSFDYISHDEKYMCSIKKIRDYLDNNTDIDKFYKQTLEELEKFKDDINYVVNTKGKIKTNRFGFMSKIKLFRLDDVTFIDFNLFNGENKNTKRTLITYLWTIYNSCVYLEMCNNENSPETMISNLQNFVTSLKLDDSKIETIKSENKSRNFSQLDSVFGSLLGNSHLLELANDISKNIEENNIDPMKMLTSMISGKPDKNMTNLLSNITNKLESKFETGELDKKDLEQTANNLLSNNSELLNSVPLLNNMMKNMSVSMGNNKKK